MRKNLIIVLLSVAILALGNSCKTHKSADSQATVEGSWMVTAMYGNSIEDVDFMRGSPSIIFQDSSSFSGSTGCNQYSAKFLEGEFGIKITIGPMTKMACPGEEENVFIKALSETNRIKREKETMLFFHGDKEVLRFAKAL